MTDTAKALPIPLRTGRTDLQHYQMGGGLVEGREFMNIYGAANDDTPSEIVAVTYGDACQERAAEIVASANEYDALKAVEAAARAAFVVLNATMTHRPSAERLHAALAALDAIRKGG